MADREAQRTARQKTKNYIAHLEELVKTLKRSSQDTQLVDLTALLEQTRSENVRLRDALSNIHRITQAVVEPKEMAHDHPATCSSGSANRTPTPDHLAPVATLSPALTPKATERGRGRRRSSQTTISEHATATEEHRGSPHEQDRGASAMGPPDMESLSGGPPLEAQIALDPYPFQIQDQTPGNSFADPESDQHIPLSLGARDAPSSLAFAMPHQSPLASVTAAQCSPREQQPICARYTNKDTRLWSFARDTLAKVLQLRRSDLRGSQEQDDDIAIRAVFHGWESVAKQGEGVDLGWQYLRQIDQFCFSLLGEVERVAMLRVMRLELRVSGLLASQSRRRVQRKTADSGVLRSIK